jgi:phage terminase large subunit-like protein
MGKVFIPKNAVWRGELMNQVLRFPAAKHDDGVDVLSLFGRGLEYIKAPKRRKQLNTEPQYNRAAHSWMGV